MKRTIRSVLNASDYLLAAATLPLSRERGVLLPMMFHSLYESPAELATGSIHRQFATPLRDFDEAIGLLVRAGYRFLKPMDIGSSLDPTGRYALITLDDGYANQIRALPVLEKYDVCATYFVATGYVESGNSFWWDVLYRNMSRAGVPIDQQNKAMTDMQRLDPDAITKELSSAFGASALRSEDELDRPMNVAELQSLARSPLITIGNHTRDHAILPLLSAPEAEGQVHRAQEDILSWTGTSPTAFAFPDGFFDARWRTWARGTDLSLGFTTDRSRKRLPLASPDFSIGRFQLDPARETPDQILTIRSPVSIRRTCVRVIRAIRTLRAVQVRTE